MSSSSPFTDGANNALFYEAEGRAVHAVTAARLAARWPERCPVPRLVGRVLVDLGLAGLIVVG